jgi:hypothetical protein
VIAHPPHGVTANRTCDWCGMPLPATLRADARFCVGGSCKQAAHRARRKCGERCELLRDGSEAS